MRATITVDGQEQHCLGPTLSSEQLALLRSEISNNCRLGAFAAALSALGHETRAKIFAILSLASRVCVCDLAKILDVTPSAVSQHLNKMKAADIVDSERRAQTIYYSLKKTPLNECFEKAFRQMGAEEKHAA